MSALASSSSSSSTIRPTLTLRVHLKPITSLLPLQSSEEQVFSAAPPQHNILSSTDDTLILSSLTTRRAIHTMQTASPILSLALSAYDSPSASSGIVVQHRSGLIHSYATAADIFQPTAPPPVTIDCGSATFCHVATHPTSPSLLIAPTFDTDAWALADLRISQPFTHMQPSPDTQSTPAFEKRGMVTALRYVNSSIASNHFLVGYESSAIDLFDARNLAQPVSTVRCLPPVADEAPPPCLALSSHNDTIAAGFAGQADVKYPTLAFLVIKSTSTKNTSDRTSDSATEGAHIGVTEKIFSSTSEHGSKGIGGVSFNSSGELASAGWDHRTRVYGVDRSIVRKMRGHEKTVRVVEWASAKRFVTGGEDGRICVWDL